MTSWEVKVFLAWGLADHGGSCTLRCEGVFEGLVQFLDTRDLIGEQIHGLDFIKHSEIPI